MKDHLALTINTKFDWAREEQQVLKKYFLIELAITVVVT